MNCSRDQFRHWRQGQVLVIVLLAMVLLVGLVFYVYNLGDQVNRRLALQNAADATAISGAAWMARSMNVVAMNNVSAARMVALVPVLDALPMATEIAMEETSEWTKCLAEQLKRGVPKTPPVYFAEPINVRAEYLKGSLRVLQWRMEVQRDTFIPLNKKLNHSGFNMDETTYWRLKGVGGAPPHGKLWQGAVALDEFSQATVSSAGSLAQHNAGQFGRASSAQTAFMVSLLPAMPARRTEFNDFRPIMEGKAEIRTDRAEVSLTGGTGGVIPDFAFPQRLGPWARLFRWREKLLGGGEWVPGSGVEIRNITGRVNIGGRRVGGSTMPSGGGGYWRVKPSVIGYKTYGPYEWALREISRYAVGSDDDTQPGALKDTFFHEHMRTVSRAKLDYMFGATQTQVIHHPQWITLYPMAAYIAQNPNVEVAQTMFYQAEVTSRYAPDDPLFMKAPGSFRTTGDRPVSIWVDGWTDPAGWGIQKVGNFVWRDEYTYETTHDTDIGISPQLDPNTNLPIWYNVYVVSWYVFGGIDIGGDFPIPNPCNWTGSEYDDLPSPMLIDTTQGDYGSDPDAGIRRSNFTYLGVASRDAKSAVWPQRFKPTNPLGSVVTVAQAKVFNNLSWDLWTQNWQVQLAPVSKWNRWVDRLKQDINDPPIEMDIPIEDIEAIQEYLDSLDAEMMEEYLSH